MREVQQCYIDSFRFLVKARFRSEMQAYDGFLPVQKIVRAGIINQADDQWIAGALQDAGVRSHYDRMGPRRFGTKNRSPRA